MKHSESAAFDGAYALAFHNLRPFIDACVKALEEGRPSLTCAAKIAYILNMAYAVYACGDYACRHKVHRKKMPAGGVGPSPVRNAPSAEWRAGARSEDGTACVAARARERGRGSLRGACRLRAGIRLALGASGKRGEGRAVGLDLPLPARRRLAWSASAAAAGRQTARLWHIAHSAHYCRHRGPSFQPALSSLSPMSMYIETYSASHLPSAPVSSTGPCRIGSGSQARSFLNLANPTAS